MSDTTVMPRQAGDPGSVAVQPLPAGPAGLVLGRVQDGSIATVPLFRPESSRVALVGKWALGRLLVFRALAMGARIVVRTDAPAHWQGLGEWATGRSDRMWVMTEGNAVPPVPADATQPALIVLDLGVGALAVTTPDQPWHTRLTILPELTASNARAVADAELHLFARLTAEEVAVAVANLRLPVRAVEPLTVLNPDMVGALRADSASYVWLTPTAAERQHLGLTG
ncbi:hypothetical protein [Actinoplanes teichomyceticus]|uniref:Uncharacterized protein n=1 Tax=Actinoplanes teichomyceticus TaxID=1867 RepID=A0A561WB91_ACTTI|nr:hypothetical protein [Actinoplanes teichomyceticus]TWG21132.1 hypothetical protein FHX34_103662 [Actinoplanes teichomyceticus]GIF14953.1 hypothetical protein Ate01nite_49850 [Actinoplanes teichomyceticus]